MPSPIVTAAAGTSLRLPGPDGALREHRVGEPRGFTRPPSTPTSRVLYAAAHVVADPLSDAPAIDWEATLAHRRELWSWGLGVAEAMDTAQRGGATVGWEVARELIRRSALEAAATGGRLVCGANTDQLDSSREWSLGAIGDAYEEQCAFIEACGAQPVLMASRALARSARSADDYEAVYDRLLAQVARPAIIHWLGSMFDPALEGYWGSVDLDVASELVLELIRRHAARVDGIKISLLDADREVAFRKELPASVRLYTGDDFDYPSLIAGDDERSSDALLGIFDAIAPAASAAAQALDRGDTVGYWSALEPTQPLARHVFAVPTPSYKVGVVFIAFLNGHQDHFRLVDGLEGSRSIVHLARLFELADAAGVLRDPDLAASRMREVLALAGIR